MQGLHIVANFYNCNFDFSKESTLVEKCRDICVEAGLTVVGTTSHHFEPHGLTFVLLLAESHLSIHTWPEEKTVAFDIYTCNYFHDNTEKTKQVFNNIKKLLDSSNIDEQFIERKSLKIIN